MMRCSDCMFFQEGEKVTFNNWFMPREETKCSLGVTLIMVPGYGVIPGPPYNLPPNQVDYTFTLLRRCNATFVRTSIPVAALAVTVIREPSRQLRR